MTPSPATNRVNSSLFEAFDSCVLLFCSLFILYTLHTVPLKSPVEVGYFDAVLLQSPLNTSSRQLIDCRSSFRLAELLPAARVSQQNTHCCRGGFTELRCTSAANGFCRRAVDSTVLGVLG